MTYWRLHYHLVWSTFQRQPTITPDRERVIYAVIYTKAKELQLIVHAVGAVKDHIHVVVSIPPKLAVSDCVRHLKGASAYTLNQLQGSETKFKWQEGFGALSVSEPLLKSVIAYANRQKEHHRERSIRPVYEQMEDESAAESKPASAGLQGNSGGDFSQ
jgi:putative transposase